MAKLMVIYAILVAFVIDSSIKSVCAYNEKLKSQKTTSQQEFIDKLGVMTLRFDKTLQCRNKDKPFVYEKQAKKILMISKKIYEKLKK